MKRWGWVFPLVLAVAGACSTMGVGGSKAKVGYVLFDCYQQTADFGFELDGIYVDEDGLVWRYHSDEPWFPDELRLGVVSESDLLHKLEGAKRVGSVNPEVLADMVALIEPASEAEVVRDMQSFERSGAVDVAYLYDDGKKRYQQVMLRGSGTWAARNPSPAARRLLERLDEIKRVVGFP